MAIKDTIKKLSIILGLFLIAVGALSSSYNYIVVGTIISIIGEAIFLLR